MATIGLSNLIGGAMGTILPFAGTPSAGTNEVQTITIGGTPTAGATSGFKLTFEGQTTGLILWSATNGTLVSNIDAALEALATVGTGGFVTAVGTMTAGVGTITLTAGGNLAKKAISTVTVASNEMAGTSPTIAIAETTPGVDATFRSSPKGAVVSDTTTGALLVNTGTGGTAPTWTAQV